MKRKNKLGFSLTEISLAVLIFAICALPLYYALSYGSTEEIQLEKAAIANKILESFRDEIKTIDYETAKTYMKVTENNGASPETFDKLLKAQQKYKDFRFNTIGSHENPKNDGIRSITFNAEVKWKTNTSREVSRKISFVKVE